MLIQTAQRKHAREVHEQDPAAWWPRDAMDRFYRACRRSDERPAMVALRQLDAWKYNLSQGHHLLIPAMHQHLQQTGAASSALLLDNISAAPKAAYWFQNIRAAYGAGPHAKVRRAGDDATADIAAGTDTLIDQTAINAHCTTNDGFLHTLYDHSANAKHLSQTTTGSQHRIYVGSTQLLNKRADGKGCFTNDGSSTGSRGVQLTTSVPNLGFSGDASITLATKFRRIAGRSDCLALGFGGQSTDSLYVWTASQTQMRLALTEAAGTTVTYTAATSMNTYQAVVVQHTAGLAWNVTVFRQDGSSVSVSASTGSGVPAFGATSIPYWCTYRDVGTNTTDRTETAPGMIMWNAVLSGADLAALDTFLATYA